MIVWTKSTYSGSTDCVEVAEIPEEKVSSFSGGGGSCVGVTDQGEDVFAVRSTITGDTVLFNRKEMRAFILGVQNKEFDHCL